MTYPNYYAEKRAYVRKLRLIKAMLFSFIITLGLLGYCSTIYAYHHIEHCDADMCWQGPNKPVLK